jgi:type I restriction enzyme M protein
MAIKKSELYSSLWQSCDELRGGMDASQYKDYVLVLLFIKYVSDKYQDQPYAPVTIPAGSSFKDMVALKGKTDIGDQINKKIIAPLAEANNLSDMPDFNDATKLGSGSEMVEKLTNLIAIFENKALDFGKNRADGDDILGDAYEYLMRHFATESGKSKGQFYTPAEVSRVIAQIIGIDKAQTTNNTTVYDPTCGSGSLLLKVADAATADVTLYGQEKDATTSGLARMNMYLHNIATHLIVQGNTLSDPKFKDGDGLKTFDYVVANPPFSDKRWSTGVNTEKDPFGRFETFGVPPAKQGDYAYLLHIIRSLKSTGQAACVLPHGVLFRGNAEAEIRKKLIRKGLIKGIIGLPANLFYGTGIPACIVVIDKLEAHKRAAGELGIFIVDASKDFLKDGNKNRLRERDIHKIVDTFTKQLEIPKYARMVSLSELEKNEYNLNIPRYIDSGELEDEGHLRGGVPQRDVMALEAYWKVCPELQEALFKPNRVNYLDLKVEKTAIKPVIYEHSEFKAYISSMNHLFLEWREQAKQKLQALDVGCLPKEVIAELSEGLLGHYAGKDLIDHYGVFQHIMDYWAATMQDDLYLIAADGWSAKTYRLIETDKKGKEKDKGWACDLIPKDLIVARYFADDQAKIQALEAELESLSAQMSELEEEHGGEDGLYSELEKVSKASVSARLKDLKNMFSKSDEEGQAEVAALEAWLKLCNAEAETKKSLREAESALDKQAYEHYPTLTKLEVQSFVVADKWLATLQAAIHGEMDRISQALTSRVKELAERYEIPLPQASSRVAQLEEKVSRHLSKMGFVWN